MKNEIELLTYDKSNRCERLTNTGLSGFADGLKRLGSLQELELDFRR